MELMINASLIFWDFDGVIKDSVDIKTRAFMQLFNSYGAAIVQKVKSHHETNGGISRFDKLSIYLRWAGEDPSKQKVNQFSERFSLLSLQGVIDAPWVPGVEYYIRTNPNHQIFVLVSATPREELDKILQEIDLQNCFTDIFGSPTSKNEAILLTLETYTLYPKDCLMIGDAKADMEAAKSNHVPFLLRRHESNFSVFKNYKGPAIKDFTEL